MSQNNVTRTGKVTMFTGSLVDYDAHADCVLQLPVWDTDR